jgi:hypothetical protein
VIRKPIFSPAIYSLVTAILLWLTLSMMYAANGPQVGANYAKVDFPDSVTFYLSVGCQAAIDSIELEYSVEQVTCGPASAKARPDFEPAPQVETSWSWDFRKSNSLPPGARIWWRWHIVDEAGGDLHVEEQEAFFDDVDYEWQQLRADELTLFSAVPDETVNQALWEAANQALDRLESEVGARPERFVKIYNYPHTQALRDAVIFTRDWTGGLALPSFDTILVGVNQWDLEWGKRAIAHELTHLVVYQVTFNCLAGLPNWLSEGLASYVEGDLENYSQEALDVARAEDALISLQSLSSDFPSSGKRATLAYAQSRQVVSYLIGTYGPERMAELLQVFKEGSTYDRALQRVYGLDIQGLDNEWRASLGLPPRQRGTAATPMSLPTLALYGADTPTAVALIPTASSTPPPTATYSRVPTPVPTSLPTVRPQAKSLLEPTLTPTAARADQIDALPLALIASGVVIGGALAAVLLWMRRL